MSLTLADLSKRMRDIDFCMLSTRAQGGQIAARPMSNNGEVEYTGDSYFFSDEDTHTVQDIGRDANVGLAFAGGKSLFGKPPLFISVEGEAELITDKGQFAAHWTPDLDRWFAGGVNTPGLVLIKVHATRIHYWDGETEGELKL